MTECDYGILRTTPGIAGREQYAYYLHRYAEMLPHACRIVEIGTFHGGSALTFAHAIRDKHGLVVTIDPSFMPESELLARKSEVNDIGTAEWRGATMIDVAARARSLRLDGYISLVPDFSKAALARWDNRPIHMVMVDGGHTYEDIKIDCGWLDHVVEGGFAVFDDWIEPVEAATREYLDEHPEWEVVTQSTKQPPGFEWLTVLRRLPADAI